MHVHIVSIGVRHSVPASLLRRVGVTAMRATRCAARAEVEVALVDDATIARLNRRFLRHTGPTDVLTFPASSAARTPVLGEVVISVERARDQARRYGLPVRQEVALLLAHGVLHLRGHRDRTPKAAARMHARARAILARAAIRGAGW